MKISGPIEGAIPTGLGLFELGALGYVKEEFFVSGRATKYNLLSEMSPDGLWEAQAGESAAFTTRLIVCRPTDMSRFNGTVLVEWMNVSAGTDIAPDWLYVHRELIRSGAAYVAVSAQRAGIDGGGMVPGPHLKLVDPSRYGGLEHPGDAYSYDIFTQTARALRSNERLLGGAVPERLLASGVSQSALFLISYINAIDPLVRQFDGFLVHARSGSAARLDGTVPGADGPLDVSAITRSITEGYHVRADVRAPVITVQSETDQFLLNGVMARQADSDRFRTWEIAGAAHVDSYLQVASHLDDGKLSPTVLGRLMTPSTSASGIPVTKPINAAPQHHYVMQAAVEKLDRWVRDGIPAPRAPLLELDSSGALRRDDFGIALGGVRTPWVDVPTHVLSGIGQEGEVFCSLFGTTVPLPLATVMSRYPTGRTGYATEFSAATESAVAAGFLLAADAEEINGVGDALWPFWPAQ